MMVNSLMKCFFNHWITFYIVLLYHHAGSDVSWGLQSEAAGDASPSLSAHTPVVMKTFSDEPGDPVCVSNPGSWLWVHLV